ncbi:Riboflavin transporter [Aphelenchoides bicaudatus]|nr:Riboflavin transporter [Aphelenchoides bicaudatus]
MEEERPNILIFLLVCCFASASWLGANSIWVELSVFVNHLPEGWKLGSVLDLVIQASSIGPLIFVLLDRCTRFEIPHSIIIQASLIVCILVNIPLAFFWDKTAYIFGDNHSVVILGSAFLVGTVNIGSDVVFVPYMRHFKNIYLPAYFIGSGFSAVFPSLVSIAQGASSYKCVFNEQANQTFPQYMTPNFSSAVFYMIMLAWSTLACFSFYILNWPPAKLERWNPLRTYSSTTADIHSQTNGNLRRKVEIKANRLRDCLILASLALLGIEINTILPSLLSYVTLPYSQQAYFWALILSALAQPVGGFLAYIFKPRKTIQLVLLSAICLVLSLIFLLIAAQSPNPVLKKSVVGSIFSVLLTILMQLVGCFLRTVLLESYRDDQPNVSSRLFWAGLCLQSGSFVGTLIMYPLVNVAKLFKDASPC